MSPEEAPKHQRRPRYRGTHPRRFEEKYKELNPALHAETVQKVIASGKTPAGAHRPIMVREIIEFLAPQPGDLAVDCTLGYGGHTAEILPLLRPGGRLLGLDADPIELARTTERLRARGFGEDVLGVCHSNFAGLPKVLAGQNIAGADLILADLGCSSMQLDNPARGFSFKSDGPLDLRMNPQRGAPASALLARLDAPRLQAILEANADEPHAGELARAIVAAQRRKPIVTTLHLADLVRAALWQAGLALDRDAVATVARRVFQALRIEVNDEFSALETFLRFLPHCLKPGGRVAVLTFHSGEDRRVKQAFEAAAASGQFEPLEHDFLRPSSEEIYANPRASSAKLRVARRRAQIEQETT